MDKIEQWKDIMASSLDQFLSTLAAYLPSLFGAGVIVIVGFVVAWLSRWLLLRLCQGLDSVANKFTFQLSGTYIPLSMVRIVSGVVYWLVLLFFFTAAAESLGLPGIAEWLAEISVYLPSVIIALFIVWAGFILGAFTRDKIIAFATASELAHAEELGAATRIAVIALTIVIGLSQIGIHIQLIEHLLVVMGSAFFISLALAFALGAGPTMSNIIALSSLKQRYEIGDRIKINQIQGVIVSFSRSSVIIDTGGDEQAMVPARLFQENASFLSLTSDDDYA